MQKNQGFPGIFLIHTIVHCGSSKTDTITDTIT